MPSPSSRAYGFGLVLVVGVGVCMLLPAALGDAFWQDELASIHVIDNSSPLDVVRHVVAGESTPPLWYLVAWLVHALGIQPVGIRLLSVVFALAALVAVAVWSRRFLPTWCTVAGAAILATAHQFARHASELRAYALYALVAIGFALALSRVCERPTRLRIVVFGATVAIGALTHYFFVLLVAAGVIWACVDPAARALRRRIVVAAGLGLVPLAAWSPAMVLQAGHGRYAWIGPFDLNRVLGVYRSQFVPDSVDDPTHVLSMGTLVVIVGACVLLLRSPAPSARLCATLAVVPVLLAALLWLAGQHVFVPRNVLGTAPFAALAIAGLASRLPRSAGLAATAGVVALLAITTVTTERRPPYDDVASALVRLGWRPSDPIVVLGDFFSFRGPLRWYLEGGETLTLATPASARCGKLFVVASREAASRLERDGDAIGRRLDGLFVALLPSGGTHDHRRELRGGLVLATTTAPGSCIHTIPENSVVRSLSQARL